MNTGPKVLELPCLTQMIMKFILLSNVKMPTIITPPPPLTVFVGEYTVFTLSDRHNRPSFRNVFLSLVSLKSHCKHFRIYKTNTYDTIVRAKGQFYKSYFPL